METERFGDLDHAGSCKFGVNNAATSTARDTSLTQPRSGPVRYEVVSKEGQKVCDFDSKWTAAYWARLHMPGEQDSNQSPEPDGWYIQIAGK